MAPELRLVAPADSWKLSVCLLRAPSELSELRSTKVRRKKHSVLIQILHAVSRFGRPSFKKSYNFKSSGRLATVSGGRLRGVWSLPRWLLSCAWWLLPVRGSFPSAS